MGELHERAIQVGCQAVKVRLVAFGYDQDMPRIHRPMVQKGQEVLVFIDDVDLIKQYEDAGAHRVVLMLGQDEGAMAALHPSCERTAGSMVPCSGNSLCWASSCICRSSRPPFGTFPLPLVDWLILVGVALTVVPVLEAAKWMEWRGWFGPLE
jgi:hypothetical protein